MDVEGQTSAKGRLQKQLTIEGIKEQVKEKASDSATSSTLSIFFVLNLAMLIVGSINLHNCPAQPNVPIYLIVAGVIGVLSKLLPFVNKKLDSQLLIFLISALYTFEIIWIIVGSVWVYGMSTPDYHEGAIRYCDKTTYLMAFWLLTLHWILVGCAAFVIICVIGVAVFAAFRQ